jgi:hypothetical protein
LVVVGDDDLVGDVTDVGVDGPDQLHGDCDGGDLGGEEAGDGGGLETGEVSERVRAMVTAGLAKPVELVKW